MLSHAFKRTVDINCLSVEHNFRICAKNENEFGFSTTNSTYKPTIYTETLFFASAKA